MPLSALTTLCERAYGVPEGSIAAWNRPAPIVDARFAFYRIANDAGFTCHRIASFCGRTCATVRRGVYKMRFYEANLPKTREKMNQIRLEALKILIAQCDWR